jgi:TolB-like protein
VISAPTPRWQALLADFRRRRVFRAMTVYGIVGFVVLQAVDLLVPVLLLPDWTYRLIGLLLLAGFPVTVALAWIFEVTPEGVRRTESAGAQELASIVAEPRRQRWPAGIVAAGATVLLIVGGWFALSARGADDGVTSGVPESSAASLAVLPFTNMSRTDDTEPFVDGVHDDLLMQLSRIRSLRVISRTSVQHYRNTTHNIREIAAELGVNHVLEGGVQRSGDQVRINVQLIDARTDEHVWAESYNRTLTVANVFAIQSEIADAIARAMHAQLSPEQRQKIAQRPTESLEAYDRYQRGMAFFRRTLVTTDVRQAVREFEAAVRIDPEFADAWARLSIALSTLSWDMGMTYEAPAAEAAVRRSEALAPDGLMTRVARGYYHYYVRREYDAALEAFRQAEALSPGDPEILIPAGWVLRRQGRWDEALDKFRAAFARDPRNWDNVYASLSESLTVLRRYAEAERYLELSISIAPDLAPTYNTLALLRIMESGDTAAAAAMVERGAHRAEMANILLSIPIVSRVLARRFGPRIRATTSAVVTDSSGMNAEWMGPELTPAAFFLQKARMLRVQGDTGTARAHFDSARVAIEPLERRVPAAVIWSQQGSLQSVLGVVYAALGRKVEGIRYGRSGLEAVLRVGDALTEPMRRADLAEIYVMVGEHELALDQLELLLKLPSWVTAASLRVDPLWATLHSHPRFQRLTAEVRP